MANPTYRAQKFLSLFSQVDGLYDLLMFIEKSLETLGVTTDLNRHCKSNCDILKRETEIDSGRLNRILYPSNNISGFREAELTSIVRLIANKGTLRPFTPNELRSLKWNLLLKGDAPPEFEQGLTEILLAARSERKLPKATSKKPKEFVFERGTKFEVTTRAGKIVIKVWEKE